MASNRKDGRGGWTAGKHRNQPAEHWDATLDSLAASSSSHRAVARLLDTSEGSVRRWINKTAVPSIETQNQLLSMLTIMPITWTQGRQ
jgi:DNA invertase Pin-like site-specific DNA recombinase